MWKLFLIRDLDRPIVGFLRHATGKQTLVTAKLIDAFRTRRSVSRAFGAIDAA
jgi:hypothetical protein